MSAIEIGDIIGQVLATAFLVVAVGGGIWAVAEFVIFLVRNRKQR